MSQGRSPNSISEKGSEITLPDLSVAGTSEVVQDVATPAQTTYATFMWILNYIKMFVTRLGRDLFDSAKLYFRPDRDIPNHICNLMKVHSELRKDRETHAAAYSRASDLQPTEPNEKFLRTFMSYVFSSEDDDGMQFINKQHTKITGIDKEPMFVLVDSSGLSNPSSKELLIEESDKDSVLKKFFNTYLRPTERPSTSRELYITARQFGESESKEELLMVDINLQSENDIQFDDTENDNESIVLAYIRNKNVILEYEGTLRSAKKKSSLLEGVPKMETIKEGERFSAFPSTSSKGVLWPNTSLSMNEDEVED